jgi:ubiquinone/menaquinone biosynthesis C-methylase UbiE
MAGSAPSFSEVDAYEQFMGRWSRAAAGSFLRWLDPPAGARWLDVGCGTGILSRLALTTSAPAALVGIDRTAGQVAHAARHIGDGRARFEVADAQALPFVRESFDVVTSGLVLNFVPEPHQAVTEMRRVVRPGGVVAAYVWDFGPELSPSGPLRRALKAMAIDVAPLPGTQASSLSGLAALFEQAGLADPATTTFEVTVAFADFRDFWDSQTTAYSPTTKIVECLSASERESLAERVRTLVSVQMDGSIRYAARANAVKARG